MIFRLVAALAAFLGMAGAALANESNPAGPGGGATTVKLPNPLGADTVQGALTKVEPGLVTIAAPIVTIMVIWGGFQMLTAAGDPEKFSKGKKTILYAAIGFAAVLFASSIVPVIESLFK